MTKKFDGQFESIMEDFETDFPRNPDLDYTPFIAIPEIQVDDTVKLDTDVVDKDGKRENSSVEYKVTKVSKNNIELEEKFPISDYEFPKGSAEPKDLNAKAEPKKVKVNLEDVLYSKKVYDNTWMICLANPPSYTPRVDAKETIEKVKQPKTKE